MQGLAKHLEDEDVDAFTSEVEKYEEIKRLDKWYSTIISKVKAQIPDENELC